jgi:hypothetical protein
VSDNKTLPLPASFRLHGLTRCSFGNRWQFGIECEVQDCELDPWGTREPFGSFWFWVGGEVVGNTDAEEQLALAFLPLAQRFGRARPDRRFQGMTNLDKLNLVIWVRFGEDEDFDAERWGTHDSEQLRKEDLTQYEVVPRGDSPWCDGWEAILVEHDTTETFVWRNSRYNGAEVHEVSLPRNLFAEVASVACGWFDQLRRERLGPITHSVEGKPRLLKRARPSRKV